MFAIEMSPNILLSRICILDHNENIPHEIVSLTLARLKKMFYSLVKQKTLVNAFLGSFFCRFAAAS